MNWWTARLCALDFETTSPDPEEARIVQAAVVLLGGGQPTESHVWLANPGIEIPEQASAIHGITTARAVAEGAPISEVVQEVVGILAALIEAGKPIVGMNLRYDWTVLNRESRRNAWLTLEQSYFIQKLAMIDVLIIDKAMDPFRKGKRNLTALCDHYGVKLEGAHDAAADAIGAARVGYKLGQKYAALNVSLQELHRLQVGWAAEQAKSLQEYLRRKDTTAYVEPAWPLIPLKRSAESS